MKIPIVTFNIENDKPYLIIGGWNNVQYIYWFFYDA